MWFWAAISMTVVANVAYQMCSKTAPSAHPLIGLTVTYGVALLTCLLAIPFVVHEQGLAWQFRQLNLSNVMLGFSIVLLETGFILAFRAGWNIGFAALVSNAAAALVLVPISVLFFHAPLNGKTLAGMGVVAIGLGLILT